MTRLIFASLVLFCATAVHAQERPRAAVLTPATPSEGDAGLARAYERVLRARLDALEVVEVEGTPALNLADLQLAVGCVAETPTCLRAVAEQLEVTALIMPSIDRAGDAIVGTLNYFDARAMASKSAVRRTEGERAPNQLLAEVDGMVRELFDLPPPEEPIEPETYEVETETTGGAATGAAPLAPATQAEEGGASPVPFVVAGVGIAALGAGVVFGLMSESTEGEWETAPTGTPSQVDAALALKKDAEREATIANVLLGVGGALVVAGAALFLVMGVDGGDEAPPSTAFTPWIGPSGAGIAVAGTFGDDAR